MATGGGLPSASASNTDAVASFTPPNMKFSQPTIDKVNKAKVMLENYYNNLLQECDEREERYRKLEESMKAQGIQIICGLKLKIKNHEVC